MLFSLATNQMLLCHTMNNRCVQWDKLAIGSESRAPTGHACCRIPVSTQLGEPPCLTTRSGQPWLTSRHPKKLTRPADSDSTTGSTRRRVNSTASSEPKTATPLTGLHVALETAIQPAVLILTRETAPRKCRAWDMSGERQKSESSRPWLRSNSLKNAQDPRTQTRA